MFIQCLSNVCYKCRKNKFLIQVSINVIIATSFIISDNKLILNNLNLSFSYREEKFCNFVQEYNYKFFNLN